MEAIKGMDSGINYFFTFQAQEFPFLKPLLLPWLTFGYYALATVLLLAFVVVFRSGQRRAAMWMIVNCFMALLLVEALRNQVSSPRPQAALGYVGVDEMYRGFPCRPVFLATLALCYWDYAMMCVIKRTPQLILCHLTTLLTIAAVCIAQFWLPLAFFTDVLGGLFGAVSIVILTRIIADQSRAVGATP